MPPGVKTEFRSSRPSSRDFSERLYCARFSCDIDYVTKLDEKLAGVDQALADLGKSEEAISEIRARFEAGETLDLNAVDSEIDALSEGVEIPVQSADRSARK